MPEPIRNRIVGFKEIQKEKLVLHPGHIWIHPDEQKQMLEQFAKDRGNTSVLCVRPHPTIPDMWEILDGKLRFENLNLPAFSCAITDLNDEEAAQEVRLHNVLPNMAVTTDATLLAMMKSVGSRVPDAESLLRKAPQIEAPSTPDASTPPGQVAKTALREIKPEPDHKYVYALIVLPISKFGEAQPHLSALEAISEVLVQKTGAEPETA